MRRNCATSSTPSYSYGRQKIIKTVSTILSASDQWREFFRKMCVAFSVTIGLSLHILQQDMVFPLLLNVCRAIFYQKSKFHHNCRYFSVCIRLLKYSRLLSHCYTIPSLIFVLYTGSKGVCMPYLFLKFSIHS